MRVFVTGGTGLLGSHVAAELVRRGYEIRSLVRPVTDPFPLAGLGEVARGDVLDPPEELARAMDGCDAVVHSAALVYGKGRVAADYLRVNVVGTEGVLEAAQLAGATRVVHVSSIAVYAGPAGPEGHTEAGWTAGTLPARKGYASSKRAAERAAWRLHDEGALRLTTVRPGVLYGGGDRLLTPFLGRVCGWPVVPLPDGGRHTAPIVYAGNAAVGVVDALEREGAVGEAYNLSDDGGLTVRQLVEGFCAGAGRPPRIVAVPHAAAVALSRLAGALLRLVPGATSASGAARRLLEDNAYPSAKARRELDWSGGRLVSPPEAVARTAAWWRSARHQER